MDLRLNDRILIGRLSSRWICTECQKIYNLLVHKAMKEGFCDVCEGELIQREDDKPDVIKERLRVYHEQTEPLVEYYREKSVYHGINGEAEIDEVFRDICEVLEERVEKSSKVEAVQ